MKLLRRFVVLILALLAIVAVAAITCPAQFALRLVEGRLGAVKLSGVSGSIWRGQASSLQVFGVELGVLDWQVQAVPLLHGAIVAHLDVHGGECALSGVVEREFDGAIEVREATIRAPAHVAAPALDIPALQLLGDLDITIARAQLRDAWPVRANGSVHWHNAAVAGAAQAQFGELEAAFASAADNVVAGTVRDLGGPLELSGGFRVGGGSYDAEARLVARDGNAQVRDALRYIGAPQADGSSLLKIHGQLFKLF